MVGSSRQKSPQAIHLRSCPAISSGICRSHNRYDEYGAPLQQCMRTSPVTHIAGFCEMSVTHLVAVRRGELGLRTDIDWPNASMGAPQLSAFTRWPARSTRLYSRPPPFVQLGKVDFTVHRSSGVLARKRTTSSCCRNRASYQFTGGFLPGRLGFLCRA